VKNKATVKFAFGSASISKESEGAIKALAEKAIGTKGYLIEVIGYADSTGHDAINTKLSEDRARAVITYLTQQGGVPVRHIVAPGAMGEYAPVASNETASGRAENRRVDINVLVHKGAPAD
jgi:outer membrane protein OmpA-like peptidoglycan-associated protein